MFQWAQSQIDKVAQHVAPPPTDGAGRFVYCVQNGDEDGAMGCIAEIDPLHTVVNHAKGWYPIHVACQYSCIRLMRLIVSQPGSNVEQTDLAGNTPLHHACMSNQPAAMECVQLLMKEMGASCIAKNYQNETPYDVAKVNSIRQYLLPVQLQAETQLAIDNGGQGLPPGIDLGGLRINNPHLAPPPTSFGGPPVSGGVPPPNMMTGGPPGPSHPAYAGQPVPLAAGAPTTPTMATPPMPLAQSFGQQQPTRSAPVSGSSSTSGGYSRMGSSSAQMPGASKYRADGFHSSSSDVNLQRKYGHASVQRYVPPPPSSGNSVPNAAPHSGNSNTGGVNPFAGAGRGLPAGNRRYVVGYGQTAPAPASQPVYPTSYAPSPRSGSGAGVTIFNPMSGGTTTATTPQQPTTYPAAPTSTPSHLAHPPAGACATPAAPVSINTPSTGMPPPPYQTQGFQGAAPAATPGVFQGAAPATTPANQAFQRPDFVSPAAATLGSPNTPMLTPSALTPTPTGAATGNTNAANVFAFSSPAAVVDPQKAADSAADAFGAPPPQTESSTQPIPVVSSPVKSAMETPAQPVAALFSSPVPTRTQAPILDTAASSVPPAAETAASLSPFHAVPGASTISRAKSAEELFAETAPAVNESSAGPAVQPSLPPISNDDQGASAADVFGASPAHVQKPKVVLENTTSVDVAEAAPTSSASAADVFGASPAHVPKPRVVVDNVVGDNAEPATSSSSHDDQGASAVDVFGASPEQVEKLKAPGNDVSGEDASMADISLSTEPSVLHESSTTNDPSSDEPNPTKPETDTSLFASIGMPPPPFSKK